MKHTFLSAALALSVFMVSTPGKMSQNSLFSSCPAIDIRGGTQHGAAGVRPDDMISGVAVYGNIFERCGTINFGGVQIHGGRENLVEGNLFIDCHR